MARAFECEQKGLAVEAAGESREMAARADDAMARRDDCHRVPAVGGADGTDRGGMPDLGGDLFVRSRLAERDRPQRVPDFLLKRRAGHVECQREHLPAAGEVFGQLPLDLGEHRVAAALDAGWKPHPPRPIVRPHDGGESVIGRHQPQRADR
jgi:hypothetical protein